MCLWYYWYTYMVALARRTYRAMIARGLALCTLLFGVLVAKPPVAHAAQPERTVDLYKVFEDATDPQYLMGCGSGGCSSGGCSYGQGYYQGYYQSYYQAYYQAYYQSYYQGYYQSYYQATYYSQSSYQTTFTKNASEAGNFSITGTISKGSGTFVIDHPLDPKNKLLYHSFVESPDAKNLYQGVVDFNASGEARVTLPTYFEALNKDFRYQLKPIGAPMPNLHVKSEIVNGSFLIGGGVPGARASWQVTGTRHDPYIVANPIVVEVEKGPDALVDRGEFIFAGAHLQDRIISWLRGWVPL